MLRSTGQTLKRGRTGEFYPGTFEDIFAAIDISLAMVRFQYMTHWWRIQKPRTPCSSVQNFMSKCSKIGVYYHFPLDKSSFLGYNLTS